MMENSTQQPANVGNADLGASALDTNQAAAVFANLLDPKEPEKQQPQATEEAETNGEVQATEEAADQNQPAKEEPATERVITFKDHEGNEITLKESELINGYKAQKASTQKFEAAAALRKEAEAEATKAREERQKYASGLQQAQSLLQAQLHEQSQIDWQHLLQTDPVEYMKQDRIARERQARLHQIHQEQQQLQAIQQDENAKAQKAYIAQQQDELLAKLPEWKDPAKAKAEKSAMRDYLKSQGLEDAQIDNISDHRVVLLSRKAMLYDQMMQKAAEATKKMEKVPPKVERPGGGETSPLDGRTRAMKQLARSGKVEDAAAVFANLL